MYVVTLDVKATHANNPDCPMRLAQKPQGGAWYCVDCGFEIMQKWIKVLEKTEEELTVKIGRE